METDKRISDVVATSQVEDEPCCGILNLLKTLDTDERQVDQEIVAIIQEAEDKCRNDELEDECRYVATNAPQLTQSGKVARCYSLHVGLHRHTLIDEIAEITGQLQTVKLR